ncbi:putative uncharacterized protein DDB_G0290521 [Cyprinodon tularosa]|uniref:putative uncharacterized protein DDB_G0290521 n=1 Tax=Cyprinodon tularosa TaxID=77115 RepID=UPI0018E223EB|nr:putative uncharacterized protein DDB_G0290521 [Cyprinodon tularosa]
MPVRQKDAQRALELLQQYRVKLNQRQQNQSQSKQASMEEDQQLQQSLDRVINIFQSQLFSALLDIQEYYELTILQDSQGSVDTPEKLPASCSLPTEKSSQQQKSPSPSIPSASGEQPQLTKPESIKSPITPQPTGQPTKSKVKCRAPPPPIHTGNPKFVEGVISKPSSPYDANTSSVTASAVESPSDPTKTSQNGTNQHVTVTKSENTTNPQNLPAPKDLNLVTVSALVSSTIQGLVSPTTPDKATPTSTTSTTSPGEGTVAGTGNTAAVSSGRDQGISKDSSSKSPTSPNNGKGPFESKSPTSPLANISKGSHFSSISPGQVKGPPASPGYGPASHRLPTTPLTSTKKYRYQEEEGTSPGVPRLHHHTCHQHPMGIAGEITDGGTLGRDGGTLGRDGGTLGRDSGTLGRDSGTLGRDGGTLGRHGGTLGRKGGTLGRDRETWRRDGGGIGSMERERERSLGRDGSLIYHGDLRGAELVQVAERQLSQIQHVHGYVTHTHIAPAQVESSEVPFDDEVWPHPEGERLNEVPAPPFSSLYSQSHSYYQVNFAL